VSRERNGSCGGSSPTFTAVSDAFSAYASDYNERGQAVEIDILGTRNMPNIVLTQKVPGDQTKPTNPTVRKLAYTYVVLHAILVAIEFGTLRIEVVEHGQVTTSFGRLLFYVVNHATFCILLCPAISIAWLIRAVRSRIDMRYLASTDLLMSALHFIFAVPGFGYLFFGLCIVK
jgi:hypothetical protein